MASQTTVMSLEVVVVVVAAAAAAAAASGRELADFSPARWEYLSLLFPRFQISPRRARECFPSLSFSVPQSG